MKDRGLFLQWAIFTSLVIFAVFVANRLGWISQLFHDDAIRLSNITLAVFVLTTAWCGRLAWKFGSGRDPASIRHSLGRSRFAGGMCWKLGILGTVIGYYLAVQQQPGASGDVAVQLAEQIRGGMGVSLVNTLVGLVCTILIEVQVHLIDHDMDRPRKEPNPFRGGES